MPTNDMTNRGPSSVSLPNLLALKRYEVPPPGYFGTFASKVLARIEAGESLENLSWWSRLRLALSARPSLASGLALIVGLSVLGATGVAPTVQSGSLERDLLLGSAPVTLHAAVAGWPAGELSAREPRSYWGTSSVAPVLASQGDPYARLVMHASFPLTD